MLLGEMLKATERAKGAKGNPGGQGAKIVRSSIGTAQHTPTLADLNLSKKESVAAQRIAALSPVYALHRTQLIHCPCCCPRAQGNVRCAHTVFTQRLLVPARVGWRRPKICDSGDFVC